MSHRVRSIVGVARRLIFITLPLVATAADLFFTTLSLSPFGTSAA